MLKINMFSSADKVKGQGVGSAYTELINVLNKRFGDEFEIGINQYTRSDISHYHTVDPMFFVSTFFKKKRGRTVGYVHFLPETLEGSLVLFTPFQRIFDWYLIHFYKRMDEIVVVNPTFIPKLEKHGISAEKVTYIPNFVSTKMFDEAEEEQKNSWREEYGYRRDDVIVLGTGQIQQRKGVDDFVQLAIDNPNVEFVWAGGFSFGKITDGYEKYKRIYDNPPKNLRFTGIIERQEIMKWYNIATVFLLPSYNELFPMSILEAFNCGTPVMLRDLELYHAIIEGDYIPTDDLAGMQEALERLIANPTMLDVYKEKSHQAAKRYSETAVSDIWFEYYQRISQS